MIHTCHNPRERTASTRFGRHAGWIPFAAVLLGHAAGAAVPTLRPGSISPEILVTVGSDAPGMDVIRVRGMWATPCLPTIERAALDGHELRIDARANQGLCVGPSTPFDLAIDPQATLGRHLEAGVYRTSVHTANGAQAIAQLRGFALLEIGKLERTRPETGFWWPEVNGDFNADARGTALSLEVQGDTVAAALMTYSPQGDATWSFGTGTLAERSVEIELIGMRDGSAVLDGYVRSPRPADVVNLQLEFISNSRATAWISRYVPGHNQSQLQLRSVALTRLPLSESTEAASWRGEWVLLRDNLGTRLNAQRLAFTQANQLDDENFRLTSPDGYVLQCRRHYRNPQSPPEQCQLNDPAGGIVARFDSVGLNRIDGHSEDGSEVQLLRNDAH